MNPIRATALHLEAVKAEPWDRFVESISRPGPEMQWLADNAEVARRAHADMVAEQSMGEGAPVAARKSGQPS